MRRYAPAVLVLLAAIWGSSYLFIEIALRDFDPAVVACARQSIAALCLTPIALRRGELHLGGDDVRWIIVIAVVMVGGPSLLVAVGQQRVSSSLAAILVSTSPLLTAVIAARFDPAERADRAQLIGIALGLAGVALLFGLDVGTSTGTVIGGAALLLASLGYAIGGFLVKHRAAQVPRLGLVVLGSAISAVLLLPAALVNLPAQTPEPGPVFALLELGAVATAGGWALYYLLIKARGPQLASLVQYLTPALAVALGVLLLGEGLGVETIAGLMLVVIGSSLVARGSPAAALSPRP